MSVENGRARFTGREGERIPRVEGSAVVTHRRASGRDSPRAPTHSPRVPLQPAPVRETLRDRAARDRETAPVLAAEPKRERRGRSARRARAQSRLARAVRSRTNETFALLESSFILWLTARARAFQPRWRSARPLFAARAGVLKPVERRGDARVRTSPRARASRPRAIGMVFSRNRTHAASERRCAIAHGTRARAAFARADPRVSRGPLARTRRSCTTTPETRAARVEGRLLEATRGGGGGARPRRARRVARSRAEVFPEPPSWRHRARLVTDGDPSPRAPPARRTPVLTFSLPPSFLAPFILVSQAATSSSPSRFGARSVVRYVAGAFVGLAVFAVVGSGAAPASMSRDSLLAIPPRADRSRRRTRLAAPPPPRPP